MNEEKSKSSTNPTTHAEEQVVSKPLKHIQLIKEKEEGGAPTFNTSGGRLR